MSAKTRLIFEGENRTDRAIGSVNRGLAGVRTRLTAVSAAGLSVSRSIRGIGAAIGILGAGGALVSLGREVILFNDNVAKLSRALGAPVQQVSALAFAADLAGAEFNSFAKIAREVNTAASAAASGEKKASDAFDTLRIDAEEFASLDLVAKFGALTQAISELNNEGVALFAAEGIVGARNATDLLNLAAGGAEGLARGLRDAQASGAVITPEQAAQAEALVDQLARFNAGIREKAVQGISAIGSGVEALTGRATDAIEQTDSLAESLKQVREQVASVGVAAKGITIPEIKPTVTFEEVDETSTIGVSSAIANAIGAGAQEGAKSLVATLLQEIQQSLVRQLAASIAGALSGIGGGGSGSLGGLLGGLLKFDSGGTVPGPIGSPRLAMVHSGETVLPTHRGSGSLAPGAGNITLNVTNNVVSAPGMSPEQLTDAAVQKTMAALKDAQRRNRF